MNSLKLNTNLGMYAALGQGPELSSFFHRDLWSGILLVMPRDYGPKSCWV